LSRQTSRTRRTPRCLNLATLPPDSQCHPMHRSLSHEAQVSSVSHDTRRGFGPGDLFPRFRWRIKNRTALHPPPFPLLFVQSRAPAHTCRRYRRYLRPMFGNRADRALVKGCGTVCVMQSMNRSTFIGNPRLCHSPGLLYSYRIVSFHRIHLTVFTFLPLLFSFIMYPASGRYKISYIDCLMLCYSGK
jgi:hypothetical protein